VPRTFCRARLASFLVVAGVRSTIGAICPNGTPNMSCSTNAILSSGSSVSRTTSRARLTASASRACSSGAPPEANPPPGVNPLLEANPLPEADPEEKVNPSASSPVSSSRLAARDRSMSRQILVTTVRSQAGRLSTSASSVLASRSSCAIVYRGLSLSPRPSATLTSAPLPDCQAQKAECR